MYIVKKKWLEIEIMTNFSAFSIGGTIGTNKFVKKKAANVYIEVYIAFWTFGIELISRRDYVRKNIQKTSSR